jgi:hypothetical protein
MRMPAGEAGLKRQIAPCGAGIERMRRRGDFGCAARRREGAVRQHNHDSGGVFRPALIEFVQKSDESHLLRLPKTNPQKLLCASFFQPLD